MEEKLERYRKQKKRKETLDRLKQKFFNMFLPNPLIGDVKKKDDDVTLNVAESVSDDETKSLESDAESEGIPSPLDEPKPISAEGKFLKYFTYLVYFLFWATLWAIAIQLKFGIVYVMLSALIAICLNTGTRRPDEPSAYSVFNANCESIDGTLKAEQFEREIGLRMK